MQSKIDEVTEIIRNHWNDRAAGFDGYIGHGIHTKIQHDAWLTLLRRLAGDQPQRVLDIGCGTGFLSLMLSELGHDVTGIDLASRMLGVARKKAQTAGLNVVFRLENAAAVTDSDAAYDLAVARHLIWLLPDPERALASWLRVLRPGGRLVLIEGKWASNEAMEKRSRSIKTALAAVAYAVGRALLVVGQRGWSSLMKRAGGHLYPRVEAGLPFSGGPPAEKLVNFLAEHGLSDISVEPLMDEDLWGEKPRFPRYVVVGIR